MFSISVPSGGGSPLTPRDSLGNAGSTMPLCSSILISQRLIIESLSIVAVSCGASIWWQRPLTSNVIGCFGGYWHGAGFLAFGALMMMTLYLLPSRSLDLPQQSWISEIAWQPQDTTWTARENEPNV